MCLSNTILPPFTSLLHDVVAVQPVAVGVEIVFALRPGIALIARMAVRIFSGSVLPASVMPRASTWTAS